MGLTKKTFDMFLLAARNGVDYMTRVTSIYTCGEGLIKKHETVIRTKQACNDGSRNYRATAPL